MRVDLEAARWAVSVYVDPLLEHGGSDSFRWKRSCHMYADSLWELHRMAVAIGMKRSWFQSHARLPHYDLVESRREAAVHFGAIEHTRREMVTFMRSRDKVVAQLFEAGK
jgi:hypothetical protein